MARGWTPLGLCVLALALPVAVASVAGSAGADDPVPDRRQEAEDVPAAAVPGASAEEDLRDPKAFAALMQDLGYRALLGRTDDGAPKIESRIARTRFTIVFGGCTRNRDCGHVFVYAGWTYEGREDPLPVLNEWNNEHVFGRAWADLDDEVVGMDMAWTLVGGVTPATLEDQLVLWSDTLEAYSKYLDETIYVDGKPEEYDGTARDI